VSEKGTHIVKIAAATCKGLLGYA